MAPCVHAGLGVHRTSLCAAPPEWLPRTYTPLPPSCARLPFKGLFATEALPAGTFLGFYNGEFVDALYDEEEVLVLDRSTKAGASVGPRSARLKYAFLIDNGAGGWYVLPRLSKNGKVDSKRYPLAMCNEPAPGWAANVVIKEVPPGELEAVAPDAAAAIGFWTCREVEEGEELFVHYGRGYNRSHYPGAKELHPSDWHRLVGRKCGKMPAKLQAPAKMLREMRRRGRDDVRVDPECYASFTS